MQVCADETQYFLPMSEATRQALLNPLSTSPRDLNRLSPALRKKHISQIQTRYPSVPRKRPFDVVIISNGPFSRPSQPSRRIGIPNHHFGESLNFGNSGLASVTPPNFLEDSDTKSEEEIDLLFSKCDDDMDVEKKLDSVEDLGNHPELVSELYKLLQVCNDTISYYQDLSKTVDLTPLLEQMLKKEKDKSQ